MECRSRSRGHRGDGGHGEYWPQRHRDTEDERRRIRAASVRICGRGVRRAGLRSRPSAAAGSDRGNERPLKYEALASAIGSGRARRVATPVERSSSVSLCLCGKFSLCPLAHSVSASEASMTIDAWLQAAVADAERRGLPALKALLEALARATHALRAADFNEHANR